MTLAGAGASGGGGRRDQHAGELTTALQLLGKLPLAGRLVTGDALYCQREFCAGVVATGDDYLNTVKNKQPALYAAIAELFAGPPPFAHSVGRLERRSGCSASVRHENQKTLKPVKLVKISPLHLDQFMTGGRERGVTITVQVSNSTRIFTPVTYMKIVHVRRLRARDTRLVGRT